MSGFGISSSGGLKGVNGPGTSLTGGVPGDRLITMRLRPGTGSKRNVEDINDTPPTRIHAKDLPIPHRVKARDPAPTYEVSGGRFELVLLDSQNPGWGANALATNLMNNWNV